jgi:hypothetical protein
MASVRTRTTPQDRVTFGSRLAAAPRRFANGPRGRFARVVPVDAPASRETPRERAQAGPEPSPPFPENMRRARTKGVAFAGDALGSVNHMLDAGGSVVNTTITNAWGEHLVDSQPVGDRYGFTQRERDMETESV